MRAPVYRNIEAKSTIAGLTVTGGLVLLAVSYGAVAFLSTLQSLLAIAGTYVLLRILGSGRPPLFWQHYLLWLVRQRTSGGRWSAAARARQPRFPFGPYR